MEPLLGMPAGWLPRDSAELDAYMQDMLDSGSIVVTDTSRTIARAVLFPPKWYVAWPALRAMQLLTIGSLPPTIRLAYGFKWRASDARAYARCTTLLRTSLRLLPPVAREWPIARRRHSSANADQTFSPLPQLAARENYIGSDDVQPGGDRADTCPQDSVFSRGD